MKITEAQLYQVIEEEVTKLLLERGVPEEIGKVAMKTAKPLVRKWLVRVGFGAAGAVVGGVGGALVGALLADLLFDVPPAHAPGIPDELKPVWKEELPELKNEFWHRMEEEGLQRNPNQDILDKLGIRDMLNLDVNIDDETKREERPNKTWLLFPGGFKPPHAGHWHVAQQFFSFPEQAERIIVIGEKPRTSRLGPTRIFDSTQSKTIWQYYIQNDNLNLSGVDVEIGSPSPYDWIATRINEGLIASGDRVIICAPPEARHVQAVAYITAAGLAKNVAVQRMWGPHTWGPSESERWAATDLRNYISIYKQSQNEEVQADMAARIRTFIPGVAETWEETEKASYLPPFASVLNIDPDVVFDLMTRAV